MLTHDFGSAAIVAMAALPAIASAVGLVIRFNVVHVEGYLAKAAPKDTITWAARATQIVLALAYAISVAYYLKLLAEFSLKPPAVPDKWHILGSNGIVMAIILLLMLLAISGDIRRVEHLAHEDRDHCRVAHGAWLLVVTASRTHRAALACQTELGEHLGPSLRRSFMTSFPPAASW